ncbi:MAG TPA: hypothetical protein VGD33_00645 [Chitinophagaceae bacterium]
MQNTVNTPAFINAQVYDTFVLANLPTFMLPEGMWRDVSMFGSGTTLNVKAIGDVVLQDMDEDQEMQATPIDTNTLTLTITDWPGDTWYITDKLREDGSQVDALISARALATTRALAEYHESRFLTVANLAQTNANVNLVNGRPHRWIAGGSGVTTRRMSLADFIAAKFAFDKANIPAEGRIAIVDPVVEASLNSLSNLVNVSNNPHFEGIVQGGFARANRFVKNIYGFDVYTSNLLPKKTATEALNASSYGLANTTAQIGDVANLFMCVADDNVKPLMHAMRRPVKTETWRMQALERDMYKTTSRFGLGAQRVDSLITIITDSATY